MFDSRRKVSRAEALAALPGPGGERFQTLFRHGTLEVEIYAPIGRDPQTPHTRDEVYVVISGSGTFVCDSGARSVRPGRFSLAPAGAVHRFEEFTPDLAVWVLFTVRRAERRRSRYRGGSTMKIGVLGSGVVAKTLAAGLGGLGHQVKVGTRQPAKLGEWAAQVSGVTVGSPADAAAFGEALVLAVKGTAASDALRAAGTRTWRARRHRRDESDRRRAAGRTASSNSSRASTTRSWSACSASFRARAS